MRSRTRFPASVERSCLCAKKTRPKPGRLSRRTVNCRPSMTRPPISLGERGVCFPVETRLAASPVARKGDGARPSLWVRDSMQKRDVRSHGLAVQVKTDRARLVGAVGFYSGLLQPLQHFAPGMSVHIPRAAGNERIARLNGREQIGRSSADTSVM